jgi:DNA-binding response OmpR family regulator
LELDINDNRRDVLIVDDDQPIRNLLSVAMTRRGLQCDGAKDGEDGLQRMRATTYAVVLLDLMMPRVGGAEFLRRLAEWQLSVRLRPVVLLMTAFADERLPVVADSIQAIIRKPFDLGDVTALVLGCVAQRRAHEVRVNP